MLRVNSVRPNVIPALILGTSKKGATAAKKMTLPQEINLIQVASRKSADVPKSKLNFSNCGSVELVCTAGLNF